jgi:predicted SprT family Zn-dependent metalloprotease
MEIERENIFAVTIDNQIFHYECALKEDADFTEEDLIERDEVDTNSVYFCDSCGTRII